MLEKIAKMFQKSATAVFTQECCFSKLAQKVTKYLGYFSKKFCPQKLSQIGQSGHTELSQGWSANPESVSKRF